MASDIVELLRPTIETQLGAKHFRDYGNSLPPIIDMTDLATTDHNLLGVARWTKRHRRRIE